MMTFASALNWLTAGATGRGSRTNLLTLSEEELRARGLDRDRLVRCLISGTGAR